MKYKKAAAQYLKKNVSELRNLEPGKAASTLKRYAVNPCDLEEEGFTLTSHAEENLSNEEQLDRIATYFANIAQEYPKLKEEDLSESIRTKIENVNPNDAPKVSSQYVFSVLKSVKKKKSCVPGDLPPRLFNNEDVRLSLAEPIAYIANSVAKSGQWPNQFKTEWGVVLKKEPNPDTEKQTRIISCINQISKALEKIILNWLMVYIKPYLDADQMGGQKEHL